MGRMRLFAGIRLPRARGVGAMGLTIALTWLGACGSSSSPSLSHEELVDPTTCQSCHPSQYADWASSMHAYASDDPVFRAMNQRVLRENSQAGVFCAQCHAPLAVRDGLTTDGLNLDQVPQSRRGVTCFFCHSTTSTSGNHNDPLVLASDDSLYGPFADPAGGVPHKAAYSRLLDGTTSESAAMCGSCHDIQTVQQAHVERTFEEWQATLFSASPNGETCAQCHMPGKDGLAATTSPKLRRVNSHLFAGVDLALGAWPGQDAQRVGAQDQLDRTLQGTLCIDPSAKQLQLTLDNSGAGHGFPSGATPDRRAWVEVTAYAAGSVIYSSGGSAAQAPLEGSADPDLWLIRDCLYDQAGAETALFWQATSVASNQLPGSILPSPDDPSSLSRTHVQKTYPDPTRVPGGLSMMPDRVTVTVHLKAIGDDVLSELVQSGDLDPALPPLVPKYDLAGGASIEWTTATAMPVVDPNTRATLLCVSTGTYRPNAVAAVSHARCPPAPTP